MDINCQAISWPQIKNILNNNFSDKRTCEELYDVMRSVSFKTNCVEFYNESRENLRQLNNKTLVVMGAGQALNACTENNRRSALNFFTSKLPEPMISILVCRDPESLEEAMDILFKAGYAYYGREYKVYEAKPESTTKNTNRQSFRNQQHEYRNYERQTGNNFNNYNRNDNMNRISNDQRQGNSSYRYAQNDRYSNNNYRYNNNNQNRQYYNAQPIGNPRNVPRPPEPMEIGHMANLTSNTQNVENFQLSASKETYRI